jgi:hypothetical protein
MATSTTTAAQNKLAKALADFRQTDEGTTFVAVLRHKDDERHVVVDTRATKIVKRFRDGESSWSDAARFASDYAFEHRFDNEGF